MARKPTAYPELIKPGEWTVEEWDPSGERPPCTSSKDRRMIVPAGHSGFAKEVRFHEMLHTRYSPEEVPHIEGVTTDSILASEDGRVNTLGARIRPHDSIKYTPVSPAIALATNLTVRGMARLAAATLGYASEGEWSEALRKELFKLSRTAVLPEWLRSHASELVNALHTVHHEGPDFLSKARNGRSEFDEAIELARWLDETFSDASPAPKEKLGGSDDEEGEYDDAPGSGGNAANARWGEMRIETPPLTIAHPNARGRRTTPSLAGTRPRNWGRLATGEVFSRTRKRGIADAVLIDQSGSMHWDTTKLHELVKKIPVGVVATYSGGEGEGVLRVVAKDGRMVAPEFVDPYNGGNEIDGPALRWLAQQKGRRVWVSDQGVCASTCHDSSALMADCEEIVKAHGIRTCLTDKPADILATLKGGNR